MRFAMQNINSTVPFPLPYKDQSVHFKALIESIEAGTFSRFPGGNQLQKTQVSTPVAVCMGAAAFVASNPKITRRFWR